MSTPSVVPAATTSLPIIPPPSITAVPSIPTSTTIPSIPIPPSSTLSTYTAAIPSTSPTYTAVPNQPISSLAPVGATTEPTKKYLTIPGTTNQKIAIFIVIMLVVAGILAGLLYWRLNPSRYTNNQTAYPGTNSGGCGASSTGSS